MPAQALDNTNLARDPIDSIDPLSRPLSPFRPDISTAPLIQGTKRKATNMENADPSQIPSQLYPPIKTEPSSPSLFDCRTDVMEDTRPRHHELTRDVGSLRSDNTEDQILEFIQNQGAATAELDNPEDQIFQIHQNQGTHPPCQQKASGSTRKARPSTASRFEDVDYHSIPDYSPPVSTLPRGNPHILQVNWRETPSLDLSKDPDRHMLHEAELELAMTLDLSCAKYLCTKLRIFQARVKDLQAGREFKKTHAQKACRINANKASKLCGAFEKVGWFDNKYFLEYLKDSNSPLRKASNDNKHIGNNPNIWDLSESEFPSTSEEDEQSTDDDDTASSSVSSDRRHLRGLNPHQENLLWEQNRGLSLIEGHETQRRELIDGTIHTHDSQSGDDAVDEDRRSRRETLQSNTPGGLPGDNAEEVPVLETRSMTRKIRLTLNKSHPGDRPDAISTIKPKSSRQESILKKLHRPVAIPHSLDEANAADTMLVEMREKGRLWREIEEAWEKKTGKAQNVGALSGRYSRIMANLSSTGLQSDKERNSDYSFTQPRLEYDDDQRLLAAEAEIEEKFQCEKADIIAEMESNFQSEKWNLVAEAMSHTGSVRFSGELIQAQYEKLTRDPKRSDAKEEENHDTIDLPRRTSRAIKRRRADEASNVTIVQGKHAPSIPTTHNSVRSIASSLSQPQHARLFLYQKRPDSKSQAIKSTSGQKSSADGAEPGHEKVRKDKALLSAEQSARSLRVWAKRRALGTHGRDGGPPKGKKAKLAVRKAAPETGIPPAPTVTYQSGHSPDVLPKQTAPRVMEEEIRRDANQHKQSLAQIIPAAPSQTGSGRERIKPFKSST